MSKNLKVRVAAVAAALAATAIGHGAWADVSDDTFRTGGCTGCFNAQMTAALATFSSVTNVVRGCSTGGTIPNNDNCDGGLGGGTGGTYRVAPNGSGNGIRCANTTTPQPIGFLATEGFDGISGNGDDAV